MQLTTLFREAKEKISGFMERLNNPWEARLRYLPAPQGSPFFDLGTHIELSENPDKTVDLSFAKMRMSPYATGIRSGAAVVHVQGTPQSFASGISKSDALNRLEEMFSRENVPEQNVTSYRHWRQSAMVGMLASTASPSP